MVWTERALCPGAGALLAAVPTLLGPQRAGAGWGQPACPRAGSGPGPHCWDEDQPWTSPRSCGVTKHPSPQPLGHVPCSLEAVARQQQHYSPALPS